MSKHFKCTDNRVIFKRIYLRFVNIVQSSGLDKEAIWSLIINIRLEYLRTIAFNVTNSDPECDQDVTFILTKYISENLNKLSKMARVSNSQEIDINFSKSDSIDFAEMFISLNSCPSFLERLYWKAFYESQDIETIALITSNIVKHSKSDLKMNAHRVFGKITPVLGFKHILYHHEKNESLGKNVKPMKNIVNIKGEITIYVMASERLLT